MRHGNQSEKEPICEVDTRTRKEKIRFNGCAKNEAMIGGGNERIDKEVLQRNCDRGEIEKIPYLYVRQRREGANH